MKFPGGASPCPYSRPQGSSAMTHRESSEERRAEVSIKITHLGNSNPRINGLEMVKIKAFYISP